MIGGGIFGCTAALALRSGAFDVTVFERGDAIMLGATLNNQNRLHLGFHYPRDLETARQCVAGFDRFIRRFPECIFSDFSNRYFVAGAGSATSPERYLAFLEQVGLDYSLLQPSDYAGEVKGCAIGLECREVVYDCSLLRRALEARMADARDIRLLCRHEVRAITRTSAAFVLDVNGRPYAPPFEAVVNCCYADINRLTATLGHPIRRYQHEYTAIPIIALDRPPIGITVMDGPFMTLLPYGKTGHFLLYHVHHSVIATEVAEFMPADWRDTETAPLTAADQESLFSFTTETCRRFIPSLSDARLIGFLQGPRIVLANRDDDDARPSLLHDYGDGYYTVFSGKIDHCIPVAERLAASLSAAHGGTLPRAAGHDG